MKNFEEWFVKESKENPSESALCALTAILLKDIFPDQNEKFMVIDNIFRENKINNNPTLLKTKNIDDVVLTREHSIIKNMTEIEKALAKALQIIDGKKNQKNNTKSNCCNNQECKEQEDKLKSIKKWW